MTCIVGYVEGGNVYMGGDSAGVSGLDITVRADEKVFKKDNMVYGFTSSFRMGQIIRYCFKRPAHPKNISDYEYMCNKYIDSLMKCFAQKGYAKNESGQYSGGTFMVGYKGVLYTIYNDFQVAQSLDDWNSVGCGEPYALGALDILAHSNKKPEKIIEDTLTTTAKFSGGVCAPFKILKLSKTEKPTQK